MEKITILNEIIRSRRAVFPPAFIPAAEIPQNIIEEMLENANWAPSHKLTEPWRFTIFKGKGLKELADFIVEDYSRNAGEDFSDIKLKKAREKILISGAVIAIIMQRHPESGLPEWEELASVSCAVQNLWLTAHAHGLGGYWSTPSVIERMQNFLKLGENQKCIGLFYLGVPSSNQPDVGKRTPISEKVEWKM